MSCPYLPHSNLLLVTGYALHATLTTAQLIHNYSTKTLGVMPKLLYSDEEVCNRTAVELFSDQLPGPPPIEEEIQMPVVVAQDPPTDFSDNVITDSIRGVIADPNDKVTLRFHSIGSTPQLNPLIFRVSRSQKIASILKFLIRRLRLTTAHVYVLSSFQPTPDESIGSLYDLFKTNQELILSYCEQIAYG